MAICRNRSISKLNELGYNVVRYPKASIQPLGLIVNQKNNFELVTGLDRLWKSESPIPSMQEETVPDLDIISTGSLKGSMGASTLLDIFNAKIDINGVKEHSISLDVINPKRVYCDFGDLMNFIEKEDVNIEEALSRYFFDDISNVHVITEVIASSDLSIVIGKDSSTNASADASDLSKSINANVDFGTSKSLNNKILFKSETEKVTFGFKSSEIIFEDEGWILDLPKTSSNTFLSSDDNKSPLLAPSVRLPI